MVGVVGNDEHGTDSPSFSNTEECIHVLQVIRSLLSSKTATVAMEDIAVIAAYRQQVLQLRHLLRRHGLGSINVGLTPDFQGSESKIVIISTVSTIAPWEYALELTCARLCGSA